MNRNVESQFSQIPSADIQRSRFDRSQDIKFTFNVGELIPFFVEEVLPGDTFDITTSKVVRLQTLLTPVMDNMYLDTYFFFVPNRLVHTHWKNIMGESNKAWTPSIEYQVAQISLTSSSGTNGAVDVGDILDYMGVPVGVDFHAVDGEVPSISAYPYRSYQMIYDCWFRDENLVDPINIDTGDSTLYWRSASQKKPYKVAKFHDVFTSCLPSPQKGPAVNVGIKNLTNEDMPVFTKQTPHTKLTGYDLFGTVHVSTPYSGVVTADDVYTPDVNNRKGLSIYRRDTGDTHGFEPSNLYTNFASAATGLSLNINDLRYAVQVQKFYEHLARGGSRYIEVIANMFNVTSPDARLQRPEYLGGNRIPISIHQIANQSQGESSFLGDLGAMSLTTDKHSDFVKSFTEHGFIIGVMCARYDHSYPQGLEKMWRRKNKFQYYWPVFAHLGEEAVYKSELVFNGYPDGVTGGSGVFGYQERWYDYRYKPNRVAGLMRPGVSGTLDSWHFADFYESQPTLSQSWIEEDKANVDRCLAVTSELSDQLFCDVYVKNFATRPMPLFSVPGLVDHF